MITAAMQKELKKIVRRHEKLGEELKQILARVERKEEDLPYRDWELKPSVLKRIERAKRAIGAGKGIVLKNEEEVRKFFRQMRHGE